MRNHLQSTRVVVTWPKGRRVLTKNAYTADGREKFRLRCSKYMMKETEPTFLKLKTEIALFRQLAYSALLCSILVISLFTSLTKGETPGYKRQNRDTSGCSNNL